MAKSAYPTGVENHGGTLRIWFIYKGSRVRESLGVPDTPKKQKGRWRAARVGVLFDKDRKLQLRRPVP